MSNVEVITCDVAGCKKPFACRIKGFNLCAEHCFEKHSIYDMVREFIDQQNRSGK